MKVALLGGARVGKDTVASYFVENGCHRLAFGDGMREAFHSIFPIPYTPKPREEYILFAQSCRKIYADVWVDKLKRKYKLYNEYGVKSFVITDVRQQNEVDFLKKEGFIFVRVVSDKQLNRVKSLGETLDINNELDVALNDFKADYVIENNGTLRELERKVKRLMEELK